MNEKTAFKAQRSLELTLDEADTAPDDEFSEIIWKAVRGSDVPLPPGNVAAFVMERKADWDD